MEVAGDADVFCVGREVAGEGGAGGGGELALELVGGAEAGGEGDGVGAEFAVGVVEDGLVDEVGAEEGGVEGAAGFYEEVEDVAGVEVVQEAVEFQL